MVSIATERLDKRRRRTRRIRRIVAAGMIVTFAAFFAVIYIRMALNKDPALLADAAKHVAARTPATTPSNGSNPGGGGVPGGGSNSPGSSNQGSNGPGPGSVTTHSS